MRPAAVRPPTRSAPSLAAIAPPSHSEAAADVPVNPVGGRDFALSIAYQVVRGALTPQK